VLVVDDGSRDPAAVAAVCRRAGADVLALPVNAGPAAARNAGLAATGSALVAFVDSDCLPPAGWLAALAGHFADPLVAAVAPRVRGSVSGRTGRAAVARARSPLDLGDHEARVRPGSRVPYVPTAALVVRRAALPAPPFDAGLRYGEDVDLVWRLHDAGWTVRYDPRTVVQHTEPERWRDRLVRRYRYGTSAGPLAVRHGARVTPLVASPVVLLAWSLLASGRPVRALAVAGVPAVSLHRALRATGLPTRDCARTALRVTGQGVRATAAGLGGAGSVVTAPVLLTLLLPRRTRRTAAVALLVPPLLERRGRRLEVGPVRWTAVRLVDDLAYALGVWRGAWAARTTAPLRPRRTRPR
jgi:mycofactocin system glycosyltransferase